MKKSKKYYDIRKDLEKYPDAWLYLIWSKRGPGKTYSTLRYMIEEDIKFIFMKRTSVDVELLCKGSVEGNRDTDLDLSPFKPLNRDFGWTIYPELIFDGFAAFYEYRNVDDNWKPVKLVGYCISAAKGTAFKGFDLSECDAMIFDEFIPRQWERVNRKAQGGEGDMMLDFYLTVSRDRLKRGRKELKFICLANATEINNPMFNTLDVINIAADMDAKNIHYYWNEYRGILMHYINNMDDQDEESTYKPGIERAMEGTAWASMAFGGHFAYNDFSSVGKVKLKKHKCIYKFRYKHYMYYVYKNPNNEYFVAKITGTTNTFFDLTKENEQKYFFTTRGRELRQHTIEGKVVYQDYQSYDLVVNYKKVFNL